MENPQELEQCPDCDGTGIVFKHFSFQEEECPDECQLCLGSGCISATTRKYYDEDKKFNISEEN